jgi:uncharacterized protein YuzE
VAVGDSYEQVVKLLGAPQEENAIRGKGGNAPVTGTATMYAIKEAGGHSGEDNRDGCVSLIFDNNGKVMSIETQLGKELVDPFR